MSLADFSFTQFFCELDEATAEPKLPSPAAASPPSVTNLSAAPTMSSSAVPIAVNPVACPATLSAHDFVLLKLGLTCALCGRLLRHKPAAIQTCGHCFCYKCINSALENGCVPLVAEWPWCTLAEEVSAAEMRWTVASGDISASAKPYHPAAKDSSGVAMQATGKTADAHCHIDEAPGVTSPAARAVRTSTVPPTRQSRKSRKLCQVCPLCLLPAFKWMLVPLPPLADLCAALHATYPQMEETLMRLTADVLDSTAPIAELQPAPTTHENAEEQVDGDGKRNVRGASAFPSLITTAFACRPLPSTANAQQCGQGSEDEQYGEESEERGSRFRRKKGARKEISFAADIASRVCKASTPAATNSHAPVNQANEPVADGPCPTHKASVGAIEAHLSNPAEARGQEGELLKAAFFASPQFSVDLIPSPALTPTRASVPRHNFSPPAWPPSAEVNVLLSTPVCRDDILGNSPAEASDYKNTQQGELGDANDMTMLHTGPTHQHENAVEDRAVVVAAKGDGLHSSLPLPNSQEHRLFSPNNVLSLPGQGSVLSPMATFPRCDEETNGRALSSTCRPVLLDSTDASWLAHAFSIPGHFLWDGVHEGEGINMRNRDQGCPTTSPPRSRVSYSTIRVNEITQEVFSNGNGKTDEGHTDHEQPHRVATSASPTIRPRTVETALASVHTEDIWEMDTVLARRHSRLPACFAALRHGRVRWEENGAPGTYGSELAAPSKRSDAHQPSPPVLCVAGHYPQGPCLGSESRSSNLRILPTLTPAACTSLLIGVPCLDMNWVMSPTSSPWTAHAVSGWRKNTTVGNKTSPLEEEKRQELNAFQDTLDRLAAAPHTFSHIPQLTAPPLASWMAPTQRALLSHLHPFAPQRCAEIDVDSGARLDLGEAYLFFLLPDGATRQLAQMLYHQWTRSESCDSQNAVSTSPFPPTSHQIQSRKRSRSEENDMSVAHDGGDWSATDGHPQRAWRRLLLVAGGAVVELSWTLFKALVATSTALEVEDSVTDLDSLVNALASHIRHQHAGVDGDLWAHVDVAEPWNRPSPLSQSATRSITTTPVAQHTFILLYSTAVARDVFAKLVTITNARGQSTHILPSSPDTLVSLPSEEHGVAAIRACLLRFKTFLDRFSSLIALAASPALPGGDSYAENAEYRHEARPSSWLLENIAEGRCCMTDAPLPETPSTEELTRPRRDADSFSQSKVAAESLSPFEEAAPTPLYRVGVYRSLLYADTP